MGGEEGAGPPRAGKWFVRKDSRPLFLSPLEGNSRCPNGSCVSPCDAEVLMRHDHRSRITHVANHHGEHHGTKI